MGFLHGFLLSALVLEVACVQFKIAAVENIVANIVTTNGNYVGFEGNTTNSAGASPSGAPSHSKRQSAYWYESIAHQGVSAFGPSGYQVFRNVKDFGARGMLNLYILRAAAVLT